MSAGAERRRDLQRRAFAPGGGLTPEEAEELRTLSQPAAGVVSPAEEPQEWVPEPVARTERAPASRSEGSASAPAHRHPRWVIPVVLLVALVVGLGVGWLLSPRPAHASPPAMNAAQQKAYDDLVAEGGFEDGSVSFAGERYGASVWTATKGGDECVVMLLDGHRSTECADPKTGSYGNGMIGVQLETGDGDLHSTVTAVLFTNITGERAVLVNRLNMTSDDDGWQGQYSMAELDLVHVLEEDGFTGPELTISGYDGDLPIWTTWGDRFCIAVVDPDSHDVTKSCTDPMAGAVVEIDFRGAVYSARFSERHGIALSVIRIPKGVSKVTCDSDTGQCTSIDDKTGDIG